MEYMYFSTEHEGCGEVIGGSPILIPRFCHSFGVSPCKATGQNLNGIPRYCCSYVANIAGGEGWEEGRNFIRNQGT